MDDPPKNAKSVDDVVFAKVNNIDCFNFGDRYNFRLLGEVICYCEDEPMTSSRWRIDRSYDIDAPGFKGLRGHCGM